MPQMAMYTHLVEADWSEKPLEECLAMVTAGQAEEITDRVTNYDDGLRSFQCADPCVDCDSTIEDDDDAEAVPQ